MKKDHKSQLTRLLTGILEDQKERLGRSEEKTYGDQTQWMDEYRHIQEYESVHGPLVNTDVAHTAEVQTIEKIKDHSLKKKPLRAGQ